MSTLSKKYDKRRVKKMKKLVAKILRDSIGERHIGVVINESVRGEISVNVNSFVERIFCHSFVEVPLDPHSTTLAEVVRRL